MGNELEMSDESYILVVVNMRVNQIQLMEQKIQIVTLNLMQVNNFTSNVANQPVDQAPDLPDADIIPWSKVMEEENGHFEVDFDTTTSGTKHKFL